ncbi:MAG: 4Fe-4S binding protein [Candidatus Zixiibacteriota bacterium]|nr:MAG: 4Fe-4S binding protein [candidate division Zixibacteria bacterium]
MGLLRVTPVILSALLLGAHFLRAGNHGLVAAALAAPSILFYRRRWVLYATAGLLITGALIWAETTWTIVHFRMGNGQSWLRMFAIMAGVILLTAGSSFVLVSRKARVTYSQSVGTAIPSVSAFFLTGLILTIVQLKVGLPLLIFERFFPGGGWIEILLLSVYAGWITEKMLDRQKSARVRRSIWMLFSVVFFLQLIVGLAGVEKLLMTGILHLPVPAMIIAGPLFRWESSIMLFLFGGALLLVGPAWCSHLCYIGAWDDIASRARPKPKKMPKWRGPAQFSILALVISTAVGLNVAGVSAALATIAGAGFGLLGVGLMVFWSRRTGVMTHCTVYCPIGVMASWLGKVSPFRIRIKDGCTDCGVCRPACRYDALNMTDIKRRRPGISCTLCGDCLGRCEDNFIEYRFAGIKAHNARALFITMAVSLHAVFMGLARI